MKQPLYLLRISLSESSPEIWRSFVVPRNISLDRLHDVIQIVMGWQDYHQHEFDFGKQHFTEFPQEKDSLKPSSKAILGKLLKAKGASFIYTYDWGDDWEHVVVLEENAISIEQVHKMLHCVSGAGSCPPEDVGGIYGYQEFCEAMSKPKHPRHKELKAWYGKLFDPAAFDRDHVNAELDKYWRWSRNRFHNWE